MTDEFEFYDAAYLMGALDPDDRAAFERHLPGCVDCTARVEDLRPTVAALRAARDAGVADEPPPVLLPALLLQAARERRRRRIVVAGSAVLAAAAVVALVVALWVGGGPASTPAAAAQALRPVTQTSRIHATAAVVDRRWGTQIDLKCRYDKDFSPEVPYDLIVVDTDRAKHPAGSWRLVPGAETTFTGGTDVPRSRIAAILITLPNGMPILQLDL